MPPNEGRGEGTGQLAHQFWVFTYTVREVGGFQE